MIREAVKNRRLLAFLSNPDPVWKEEDYPEFQDGAEAWVRRKHFPIPELSLHPLPAEAA